LPVIAGARRREKGATGDDGDGQEAKKEGGGEQASLKHGHLPCLLGDQ
jgi:hypothetical protein